MLKNFNIIAYTFTVVCVIRIGLSISERYFMEDIIDVHERQVAIQNEYDNLMHFDDSLAGNEAFKRRLMDTIRNEEHLRQVRIDLVKQLERKNLIFESQFPNRGGMLRTFRIVSGLKLLLNGVLVCLGIPLFILLIRERG